MRTKLDKSFVVFSSKDSSFSYTNAAYFAISTVAADTGVKVQYVCIVVRPFKHLRVDPFGEVFFETAKATRKRKKRDA